MWLIDVDKFTTWRSERSLFVFLYCLVSFGTVYYCLMLPYFVECTFGRHGNRSEWAQPSVSVAVNLQDYSGALGHDFFSWQKKPKRKRKSVSLCLIWLKSYRFSYLYSRSLLSNSSLWGNVQLLSQFATSGTHLYRKCGIQHDHEPVHESSSQPVSLRTILYYSSIFFSAFKMALLEEDSSPIFCV